MEHGVAQLIRVNEENYARFTSRERPRGTATVVVRIKEVIGAGAVDLICTYLSQPWSV
jgi:hypothetical protein